jgi:hypothetical protein
LHRGQFLLNVWVDIISSAVRLPEEHCAFRQIRVGDEVTGYNHELDRRPPVANGSGKFFPAHRAGILTLVKTIPMSSRPSSFLTTSSALEARRLNTRIFDKIAGHQEKERLIFDNKDQSTSGLRLCSLRDVFLE